MARIAEVAGLSEAVFVVGRDGRERLLQAGDRLELRLDDSVAQTEATPTAGEVALAPPTPEAVLQAFERGVDLTRELEPTAAGDASGGGGEGSSFVRLLRIIEEVEPLAYAYSPGQLSVVQDVELGAAVAAEEALPVLSLLGGDRGVEGYSAEFTVDFSINPVVSVDVTLKLGQVGDSATKGEDYTGTAVYQADGTLLATVAADGSFTLTGLTGDTKFYVRTTDDVIVENDELLTAAITGSGASAAVSLTNHEATAAITDDDALTLTLTGPATVAEGETTPDYAVRLGATGLGAGQSVTFTLDSASGTATEGSDFEALLPAALTAGAGAGVSLVTGAADAQGIITVTATAGAADLAAGATLVSFNLATRQDLLVEGPETFTLDLASRTATVDRAQVETAITDDDVSPTVGNSASYVSEEGLPAGIPDGSGFQGSINDSTNSAKHLTGTLPLTLNGPAPLTIELINPGSSVVGTTALSWAHGTSQAVLIGSDAGGEIIRVTLNGGSVNIASPGAMVAYTVELSRPIQHALAGEGIAGEDAASLNLMVRVSDGVNTPPDIGTISIVIEDDSPQANPDADSLSSIQVLAETGNVITGEGTAGGIEGSGVDLPGADGGATVSAMVAGTGAYGQLTMTADGAYRYQLHASGATVAELLALDVGESRTDTFGYMIKDTDADTSSTILTFTINAVNDLPTVTQANDNADPINPGTGNDRVYESHLPAGTNPSAPVVDLQGLSLDRHATGTITLQDPDGLDDIQGVRFQTMVGGLEQTHDFTDAQLRAIVSDTPSTQQSFATQNGVVTLTAYHATTGVITYRFELTSPATDIPGTPDPVESNQFTVATRDETASYSQPATVTIEIVDDLPQAERNSKAVPTLILDESSKTALPLIGGQADGVVTVSENFSDNFQTPVHGADGPASSNSVLYGLQLTGSNVASGLFALNPDLKATDSKGDEILLTQSGNTISGQAHGQTYFEITVVPDGTDAGKVTFTSFGRNVWHGDPAQPDDPASLTLANPGDLRMLQTVTDGDGDQASDHIDLGREVFRIEDDGPVTHHYASGQPTDYLSLANGFGTDGGHVDSITLEGATYAWNDSGNSIQVTGGADPLYSFDPATHRLVVDLASGDQFGVEMDDGQYDLPFKPSASGHFDVDYTLIDRDGDRVSSVLHVAYGEDSNDSLQGFSGDDLLIGGFGDDTLAGGLGADVFQWRLGDQGTTATPTVDHVDFAPGQHDVLDLRDLLTGEHATDDASWNLGEFLGFGTEGGKLALLVDHDGSLAGATQKIVFEHFSSTAELGDALSGYSGTTDTDLIKQLVEQGNLKLDP